MPECLMHEHTGQYRVQYHRALAALQRFRRQQPYCALRRIFNIAVQALKHAIITQRADAKSCLLHITAFAGLRRHPAYHMHNFLLNIRPLRVAERHAPRAVAVDDVRTADTRLRPDQVVVVVHQPDLVLKTHRARILDDVRRHNLHMRRDLGQLRALRPAPRRQTARHRYGLRHSLAGRCQVVETCKPPGSIHASPNGSPTRTGTVQVIELTAAIRDASRVGRFEPHLAVIRAVARKSISSD